MSNKKSNPQGKKAATLDNDMVEEPTKNVITPAQQDVVDLKEYRKNAPLSFSKKNYKFLFLGLGINILGYILMIGGAAKELNDFDADSLFSTTRITIAPMLIVAGFIVMAYAIMRKPKTEDSDTEAAN